MNYLAFYEKRVRGTFDFPIEFHYVDQVHPRYNMPFHWHLEHELILILQGTFTISLDGELIELQKGDCVFIPDGVIHGGTPHNCIYECVVFDFNTFLQNNSICSKLIQEYYVKISEHPLFFKSESECAEIISNLFEAMEKEFKGYELITLGLLWQLMGVVVQKEMPPTSVISHNKSLKQAEQIKKVLSRIRLDYAQPLTLDDLASEANMAPKYFCRLFRQITGKTPIDYLNYYRVECASEKLLLTGNTVTDIALSCGFNDASYFNKVFKHYKKCTPKKYKQLKTSSFHA